MIEKKVSISESLQGLLQQMTPQQEQYVIEMFQFYMEQYGELRIENNAESVSDAIHKAVDNSMQESIDESEEKVTCGKGCSFCCYQQVDISDDEATLITEYTREISLEIPYDKLEKQAEEKDYKQLPFQEKKCVFLNEEDSCSIYEHRPSACRKLVSVSEPSLCDIEKHPNGEIKKLVSIEAEVMTSSSLNVRESGSMAKMLIAAKK